MVYKYKKGVHQMSEKKSLFKIFIKEVFTHKRSMNEDIIYQAEKVISDYIERNEGKLPRVYASKKKRHLGFMLFIFSVGALFCLYKIFIN